MDPWYKDKRFLVGALTILLTVTIIEFGIIFWRNQLKTTQNTKLQPIPTQQPFSYIQWKDASGFLVEYPDQLTVNPHEEDDANYAHVEFSSPDHQGSVVIWAKDAVSSKGLAYQNSIDWQKDQKDYVIQSTIESLLGGKQAIKFVTDSEINTQGIASVYDGIVWIIETRVPDSFWQEIYLHMIDTFQFTDPEYENETSQAVNVDVSDTYEDTETVEEEIVE
jgi:hypothetical protein